MRIVFSDEKNINHLINILSVVSFLSFLFISFHHSFLIFSFTEGWYSSWASANTFSEIYSSGFPFPPIYITLYKSILNLFDFFSIDPYFGLRLVGASISFINLWIIFRIATNLGSKKNFSLLISSCSLIIFSSMEAFVNYDYTPFLGIIMSALALLITEKERKIYFLRINFFPYLINIINSLLLIALIGTKQSAIPIALLFILVFSFTRRNKLERINFLLTWVIFLIFYVLYFVNSIGYEQFLDIYTNAEYKGGADKIIKRAPKILVESSLKLSPGSFLGIFKESIFFLIVFLPVAIISLNTLKIYKGKRYWLIVLISSLLTLFGLFLIPQVTNDTTAIIKNIRESGVVFLIFSTLLGASTFIWYPNLENYKKKQILWLVTFLSSIIFTNVMSGGTGAFDSFLLIPVFAILINKLIDEFKIYENSDQFMNTKKNIFSIFGKVFNFHDYKHIEYFFNKVYFIIINFLKLFFSGIIACISFSGMADIYAKGYTWWGMVEKSENEFVFDKLMFFTNPTKNKIPGSFFMTYDQRKYTDRSLEIIDNYSNINNILAFPNIPYFYEASSKDSFAGTPLNWIDVTSLKSSKKQKNEWNQNKPEIIIFNLMHSDVFNIQVRAFSDENQGEHSFKYINSKILDEIIKGNYIIVDSYLASNTGYGLFTLVRKDIFEKNNPKSDINYSKKQSDMINTKLEINEDILSKGFSYSTMVCMDKNENYAEELQFDLFKKNNIDCKNSSRVNLSEEKPLVEEYSLNRFNKKTTDISRINNLYMESLKDNKFANNLVVFTYLFSFFNY